MKRIVVPLALILGGVAVALVLGEIMLRAIGYSAPRWYEPNRELGWSLRPGAAGWQGREGRAFVEIGPSGRRDREYPLYKAPDVYRIAVLGDSYSEAMQVPREQAFWALLPRRLAACGFAPGKRIEALNFGVSGYGTAQEYVMLQSTAMRYGPDLVLLQFTNGNDVKDNSFALDDEKSRPFYMLERDGTLRIDESFALTKDFRKHSSLAYELARRVSDSSRILQLVRTVRVAPLIGKAQAGARSGSAAGEGVEQGLEPVVLAPPRDVLWDEAWRITEGLIGRMNDYSVRNGARFMVITVPYAIQVHPDRKLREALQARLGVPDLFYPDNRIAAFAKRHGILALPLAPLMQRMAEESGAYFHGFQNVGMGRGHWNAEGHRVAAELIAQRLCQAS